MERRVIMFRDFKEWDKGEWGLIRGCNFAVNFPKGVTWNEVHKHVEARLGIQNVLFADPITKEIFQRSDDVVDENVTYLNYFDTSTEKFIKSFKQNYLAGNLERITQEIKF